MKKYMLMMLAMLSLGLLPGKVTQSLVGADSLSLGSIFSFVIETDFTISEIVIPDSLSSFRVLDTELRHEESGSQAELSIMPLRVGALSFPKLELKAKGLFTSGGHTDGFRVYVLTTRADADTVLRDIKPPLRYRWQPPFWLYLFVFLAILVLATLLVILALQKKPAAPEPPQRIVVPEKKLIPPYKTALDKLDKLEKSGLAESDILAYHYQLSLILREFLEHTYHFNAIEMTLSEIEEHLAVLQPKQYKEYIAILRYCDQVKFAKLAPTPERIQLQTQALRLCLIQSVQGIDV